MDIDNLYISNVHARRGGKTDTMWKLIALRTEVVEQFLLLY